MIETNGIKREKKIFYWSIFIEWHTSRSKPAKEVQRRRKKRTKNLKTNAFVLMKIYSTNWKIAQNGSVKHPMKMNVQWGSFEVSIGPDFFDKNSKSAVKNQSWAKRCLKPTILFIDRPNSVRFLKICSSLVQRSTRPFEKPTDKFLADPLNDSVYPKSHITFVLCLLKLLK